MLILVLLSTNDKNVTGLVTRALEGGGAVISGCSDLASIEMMDTAGPIFVFGFPIVVGQAALFDEGSDLVTTELDFVDDAFNAEDAMAITVSAAALATSFEMGVFEK